MSQNRVNLDGRLCHDLELQRTKNGTPVVNFMLAVSRDYKDQNTGERGVDWIELQAYRTSAEFICKHFGVGDQMIIDGRLQVNSWVDKYGDKHKKVIVLVERVYFGQTKRSDRQNDDPGDYYPARFHEQDGGDDCSPPF